MALCLEVYVSSAPLREVCAVRVNAARVRACVDVCCTFSSSAMRGWSVRHAIPVTRRIYLRRVCAIDIELSKTFSLRGMPHRDQRHVSFAAIALTRHRAPYVSSFFVALELAVKAARRAVSARLCMDVCRCPPDRPPYGTTSLRTCVCAQIFEYGAPVGVCA